MKKILFIAFAGFLCMCTSCNSKSDTTAGTENGDREQQRKNMAASDIVSKAFQTGDVSGLDSVIADDFIDHTDRGDKKGRDSVKAMVNFIHANFKDMKTEKIGEAAEGDYVYNWMRYSGTSDGSMGMPKGPYTMNAVELAKFKDGKAVEHWSFMDMQDMAKMMPPPDMNKTDTSKKK